MIKGERVGAEIALQACAQTRSRSARRSVAGLRRPQKPSAAERARTAVASSERGSSSAGRFSERVMLQSFSMRAMFWKRLSPLSSRGSGGRTRTTTLKLLPARQPTHTGPPSAHTAGVRPPGPSPTGGLPRGDRTGFVRRVVIGEVQAVLQHLPHCWFLQSRFKRSSEFVRRVRGVHRFHSMGL